jgi:hypothetical protein
MMVGLSNEVEFQHSSKCKTLSVGPEWLQAAASRLMQDT